MSECPIEPILRNAWYIAAWGHEVTDKPLARKLVGEDVVLFRDASGRVGVLEDRCCHRAAPLSIGSVVEAGLQCGYHGMIFGRDGECTGNPGEEEDRGLYRVRAFPIVERQNFVWVWMGDPRLADESTIVDYPFHDAGEEWPFQFGCYRYAANFMFVIDNLMDLTHLGYVHGSTIGGFPQSHVDAEMETEATENGAKFLRWMMASPPPPSFVAIGGFESPVDRWSDFEYVAPASVLQWGGALDVGRGARENRNQEGGVSLRLFHHATPESETSCHYFWSVANRNRAPDSPEGEQFYRDICDAFLEDKAMIEAQQAAISRDPGRGLHYRRHDEAVALARRALHRMSAAELRSAAE
ncbi:MAG: aromatic ring-hydroxylating dioxygenase subunit alpha [Defluviicoccus sp.]|nr:aromatic ring-hydroxylating dioxygenase subunit alpha [Defluviicoccus sp.]